jgi:hypothetical protein
MHDNIGIDISKDTLDSYWLSKRKHKQFANTKGGLKSLIRWAQRANVSLVVFEATGVYHRLLETCLATHSIPLARVNPRQARRFTEGSGTLAKTDQVDAAMLSRMRSLLVLKADTPKSETLHNLKELGTARQALGTLAAADLCAVVGDRDRFAFITVVPDKTNPQKALSMSWWLSKHVQKYLDEQISPAPGDINAEAFRKVKAARLKLEIQ